MAAGWAHSDSDQGGRSEEERSRVNEMLRDLAVWVDRDGNGEINYMEFMAAFQLVDRNEGHAAGIARAVGDGRSTVGG